MPLVWRFRKAVTGSGVLGDLGSHMIDMVRFLVGNIQKVCAHAGTFIKERKLPGSEQTGVVDVDDFCNFIGELKVPASFAGNQMQTVLDAVIRSSKIRQWVDV